MDIYNIINDRLKFPIGSNIVNKDDIDYIEHVLNTQNQQLGVILPKNAIDRKSGGYPFLKELLLSDWHISGIFDLAGLMQPLTGVCFNLYWLTKDKPEKTLFSIYKGSNTYEGSKSSSNEFADVIAERSITDSYKQYLDILANVMDENKLPNIGEEYQENEFFEQAYDSIDLSNLSIRFYSPEMVENRKKLEDEITKPLGELAEIIIPRPVRNETGKVCKPKNLKDLNVNTEYDIDKATDVTIQKGDILVFSRTLKTGLVDHVVNEKVYASNYLYVIRPTSKEINSEFLFLYLNSDTAQRYFSQFEPGVMGYSFGKERVNQLPVIIPVEEVKARAPLLYQSLYRNDKSDIVDIINKELFNPNIPKKPFQEDLIKELLNKARDSKLGIIQDIVAHDLDEIEKCLKSGAYKSVLILSGSVLEAILLDWLSEVEGRDYINSNSQISLIQVIKNLKNDMYLTQHISDIAHKIRMHRNCVHPAVYLKSDPIPSQKVAAEVLSDLRKILNQRLR